MNDQAYRLRNITQKETRIITVTSGKGGVGKTSLSVNLSVQLALMKKKVLLLDADLGTANVDILLGIHPEHTLADVINQKMSIQSVVESTGFGVKVIGGVSGMADIANLPDRKRRSFIRELSKLSEADYLVIDTGAGISRNVIDFVLFSEDAFIVVTPEPTSIQDAYGMIKVLSHTNRSKLPEIQVVVNQAESEEHGREIFEIINKAAIHFLGLHVKYYGMIPHDRRVRDGVIERRPFVVGHPICEASKSIQEMAKTIDSQIIVNSQIGSGIPGLLNRLLAKH